MEFSLMKRACGILLPIFSLPGNYGIGGFSKEAYRFIDQLKEAGQSYWQILPLGPAGLGNSPYQCYTAFAGDMNYISLEKLIEEELLSREEVESADWGGERRSVSYEKLALHRENILRSAFERYQASGENKELFRFDRIRLSDETKTYCVFQALKKAYQGLPWMEWEEGIRLRKEESLAKAEKELAGEIEFYEWVQRVFAHQLRELRAYAGEKGIKIIGDMPIYISYDSADAWSHPELFLFNEDNEPEFVAGCPPDYFAPEGQRWGNPLYDWDYHRKTEYEWWIKRMEYEFGLYDYVRIDHFRGFDEYYSIPSSNPTAIGGTWMKGPNIEIFDKMKEYFAERFGGKELPIIVEDMGFITESVVKLVKDSGFPSMKVLEFAFDSDFRNIYLPHNYERNCVAYTGTHDNLPLKGWIDGLSDETRLYMIRYLGAEHTPYEELHWDCIRTVLSSVADTVIIPMQDYLGLGKEARINEPGTESGNWRWRMLEDEFGADLIWHCEMLSAIYGRKQEARKQPEGIDE